jgi:hypothetical protein
VAVAVAVACAGALATLLEPRFVSSHFISASHRPLSVTGQPTRISSRPANAQYFVHFDMNNWEFDNPKLAKFADIKPLPDAGEGEGGLLMGPFLTQPQQWLTAFIPHHPSFVCEAFIPHHPSFVCEAFIRHHPSSVREPAIPDSTRVESGSVHTLEAGWVDSSGGGVCVRVRVRVLARARDLFDMRVPVMHAGAVTVNRCHKR